jgi:hypothetical protein
MKATTVRRLFPKSQVTLVHQNGVEISDPTNGVEIVIYTRENDTRPCCAEIISGEHYAEIGLEFQGNQLVDYDGVFFLPRELGLMLKEAGYIVADECFENRNVSFVRGHSEQGTML